MDALALIVGLSALAWLYLLAFHGRFWRAAERLPDDIETPGAWPPVAVVVPARNEADVVGETVRRLAAQDYPGALRIVVVDDRSEDGTGEAARAAADTRTAVLRAGERPAGWVGKVWAMEQGLRHLRSLSEQPDWILFTDADIHHPPDSLRRLVAFALDDDRDLVSLMVKLKVATFWERLLVPAFVFFFAKLYPFARVNDPADGTAAAAGGCMLARRTIVEKAGLMESIRDRLIDDCALARAVHHAGSGRIWIGLTETVESARPYDGLKGVWQMVVRSAFTQLRHSPLLLAGTVIGMAFLYLAGPVALAVAGAGTGLAAWGLMALAFVPMLRLYRQPVWFAPLLPLAGFMYTLMTIDSAARHWRGRGGGWKGRYQARKKA
ncbi:glycosyltransferase [Minwuia thermotolerans]|uniref:Glycosyl transferase family 2 n=1 Tax=Minwuia thermotolerans TaxID=2056226 RepID=A0A2M9G755_9PROT|nr:glycosyltransferase [Minwuia thermotolerans]PJK31559.1 glycosyl transferase family 2 [Minwuia thermotolerans]